MKLIRASVLVAVMTVPTFASASDMAKFYHAVPHKTADAQTSADALLHPSSGDAHKDVAAMETAGFELIGYSAFNGKEAGEKGVLKEAKRVGATDVIYLEHYTDTQSAGAIGNTSFSRWGAFSFVTPMSVRRYDQMAMYFRKAPHEGMGVYPRVLKDEEKEQIGSNKGLFITAVVNGSPAFAADILPGDILLQINGHAVWDAESSKAAIDLAKGKTSDVQLYRSGQLITKQVTIPAGNW
jgi:membrane-associated protease RseP (regulator of RpoE activity)